MIKGEIGWKKEWMVSQTAWLLHAKVQRQLLGQEVKKTWIAGSRCQEKNGCEGPALHSLAKPNGFLDPVWPFFCNYDLISSTCNTGNRLNELQMQLMVYIYFKPI